MVIDKRKSGGVLVVKIPFNLEPHDEEGVLGQLCDEVEKISASFPLDGKVIFEIHDKES